MSRRAWAYILIVLLSAIILFGFSLLTAPQTTFSWLPFLAFFLLGFISANFEFGNPSLNSLHAETVFFFAGLFLLPFWQFCLLVMAVLLSSWVWKRFQRVSPVTPWVFQWFQIAKEILSGASAYIILTGYNPDSGMVLHASNMLIVLATALVYSVVNQTLQALVLKYTHRTAWEDAVVLRDIFLNQFPLTCLGYAVMVSWNINPWMILVILIPLVLVYQTYLFRKKQLDLIKQLEAKNQDLILANKGIQALNGELFQTIARVFDARDPYVSGHAGQVAAYAVDIAKELGLPRERIETIRRAGYLHDIGKIAISDSILNKAGSLTQAEYFIVQQHTIIGANLIESCEGIQHLAPFIRYHHERWDGLGYPEGLRGANIPLEARILNLCDSVESMAADRPYQRGMAADEVVDELRRCKNAQFDPILAETFIEMILRNGKEYIVNSAYPVEKHLQPVTVSRPPTSVKKQPFEQKRIII